MYHVNHMPRVVELGTIGDNHFKTIQIDMTPWLRAIPRGVASIIHIRPGETEDDAYIAATDVVNGILMWEPTAGDLGETEGYGSMQIWLEDAASNRGKSVTVQTYVRASIVSPGEIPEPQESWMEQMTALKVATVENAEDAADSAADAADAKDAAEEAQALAEAARDAAQAAAGNFQGITAEADTLDADEDATIEVTHSEGGLYNFDFGVPKGTTFTPAVSEAGVISWTNDGGKTNPESVNIKGPQGDPAPAATVTAAVDAYLEENFTNPDSPPLDRTLLSAESAAPADMVGDLKNALNTIGTENLFNGAVTTGKYLDASGNEQTFASAAYTNYISVSEGHIYNFLWDQIATPAGWNLRVHGYNSGKVWQSQIFAELQPSGTNHVSKNIVIPSGIAYIRISLYYYTYMSGIWLYDNTDKIGITAIDNYARSISHKINNLVPEWGIVAGYWSNAQMTSLDGTSQYYRSFKTTLPAGEYTISFGTTASIIRLVYDGRYISNTIRLAEGDSLSFRKLTDGDVGFSFVQTSSGNMVAFNTWVQLEKNGTMGEILNTAIDADLEKSILSGNHLLALRKVKKSDIANGVFSYADYSYRNDRLTNLNWYKVSKGDLVVFKNKNIAVTFHYFKENGSSNGVTDWIYANEVDVYHVEKDGYLNFHFYNIASGSSAEISRNDYDNILDIISMNEPNVYQSVYAHTAMQGNMKAKRYVLTINGQDGCVVGDTLWSFADGRSSAGMISAINLDTMATAGTGSHQLGHANSVDYDASVNTLMLFGSSGTNQPHIVLYKNPSLESTMELTDENCVCVPLYDQSGFMNWSSSVCFGEAPCIAYLIEGVYTNASSEINPVRNIHKILLGMGDNDLSSGGYGTFVSGKSENEYNGTCKVIKTYTGEIIPGLHCFESANTSSLWTPQGISFNGYLYVAYGTAGNNYLVIALNDNASTYTVVNNLHFETMDNDGSTIACEPEMLAIYGSKMYCGVHGRTSGDNYLYEIQM